MQIKRLARGDRDLARSLFMLMAEVFETNYEELTDAYLDRLLDRTEFWAIVACIDEEIIGGLTAHTLPMTRSASSEIFIYDLAVRSDQQRKGVGRRLVAELRATATAVGIHDVFVPADNDDTHALDFYHAIGGSAAAVTIFSFTKD